MKCCECDKWQWLKGNIGHCYKVEKDKDDPLDGITTSDSECEVEE